ncbi:hypothetical protein J6590_067175 [Homalodisca vitripennis]|nr:hypothetical protein J6590_067175 [Homalodisca vitripennis]
MPVICRVFRNDREETGVQAWTRRLPSGERTAAQRPCPEDLAGRVIYPVGPEPRHNLHKTLFKSWPQGPVLYSAEPWPSQFAYHTGPLGRHRDVYLRLLLLEPYTGGMYRVLN